MSPAADFQIRQREAAAPAKPAHGQPCNGCGVCCLYAPCPLGLLLSGHRHGACAALRWDASATCYRCGAIADSAQVLQRAAPALRLGRWPGAARLLARWAPRWVAAGRGCDSTLEVLLPATSGPASTPATGAAAHPHPRTPSP